MQVELMGDRYRHSIIGISLTYNFTTWTRDFVGNTYGIE